MLNIQVHIFGSWDKSLYSMAHHLLQNCCCWLLAAAAADSIINISVLYCYLGVITLVWCEMFALWICSSYISSCVRGCSVALSQSRLTYRHDLVLHCIVSNLSRVFAESHVYAELPGMHASVSPQANSYCNILLSWHCNLPWILQFSCSVWSDMYFGLYSSFGICKGLNQTKEDYLQILSELHRLVTTIRLKLVFWVTIYNPPCPHCAMHLVSSKP